jgi:YjbE family integral membrane protein
MYEWLSSDTMATLIQVVVIDVSLAGDNAMVIGMAAAGLPDDQRNKVIIAGTAVGAAFRILFASVTAQLLSVPGLIFVGGLALLWVCWRMVGEIRHQQQELAFQTSERRGGARSYRQRKTFIEAARQIVIADVSMSLDNVLAVAGAAHKHPMVLVFALLLSVLLMCVAASYIARLLKRFRWLAYIGVAVVLYVATEMVVRGSGDVWTALRNFSLA